MARLMLSKIMTKIGDTVNLSWAAPFFPVAGQYLVYHTYRENRTIFSIRSNGVSYGGNNQSAKYTYLTTPFYSTNIMFEIRDITLDDAGYYNGGISGEAAWSGGVVKIKTKVGDTVNLSWTALFFPIAGEYNVFHTYKENRTIVSVRSNRVSYGGNDQSTKYTYLTRPFTSTNIMFEIRDITLDDAGYYNGGTWAVYAWSGGGVVLIVHKNSAGYYYQGNVFTKILFFYFGIDSIFEAAVPWYHVIIKNRSLFYLNKKSKSVTLPRRSFVCLLQ
uniref:Uncharacterized protein n=1 Tax=Magallana gigas TaxID=29159 RepID=K1QMP1_MAGGI